MPKKGLGSATSKPDTPKELSTKTTRQVVSGKGNTAKTAREKEPTSNTPRIARYTRSQVTRVVPPIPDDVHVLHHPLSGATGPSLASSTNSPHRPAPQVTLRDLSGSGYDLGDLSALSLLSDAPSTSVGNGKKGGKRTRNTAKQEEFSRLRERILDDEETNSFDVLAKVFAEVIVLMKGYKTSAPIAANWDALDAIAERLVNHHTFPRVGDDKEAFGAIVTRSVSAPVKELAARMESQNKAIISLTKTVESLKKVSSLTDQTASSTAPKSVKSYANAASKPIPPPIPNPSDERILVRFDGEVPPLFHQPYHEILAKLNAHLASLDLPGLVYTQKQSGSSIFIVPRTKDDVKLLSQRWSAWAPGIFPGGRIAPVAEHCYLQVNGIPFRAVDSLDSTAREFEERNPALGKVLSVTWVNRPPSVEKVAAIAARGLKPPTAGSLFIRLQSRDLVDRAVAAGRVVLGGMAPMVQRGFPHLRVCQCWGCLKFGHTRSRCGVKTERCGGCGKDTHGICTDKPTCINCGETHRSDTLSCPARKRIAAQLNQRAADICRALDEASIYNKQRAATESGSPMSATSTLLEDSESFDTTPHPALRLHERK
ncbi:hypothetical protein C8F04DRAFT_1279248 [Mycena alexandri]|uniref:Gag-like protein n=1 Tax=Mycena alexandri TaxID=1745969 RepID=A0AAD6RXY5_9AGAR|nr:hypothetical protein C8F04DRAFT_1279248 [Mycena alexandri]